MSTTKSNVHFLIGLMICNALAIGAVLVYRSAPGPISADAVVLTPVRPGDAANANPLTPSAAPPTSTLSGHIVANPPLPATPVSLHLKNASPEDALTELGRQSGLRFNVRRDNNARINWQPVTLDLDKQPALECLLQLCSQAGLIPDNQPPVAMGSKTTGRISLSIAQPNTMLSQWCVSGPFAFIVNRASAAKNPQPPREGEEPFYGISMSWASEPGIRILSQPYQLTLQEVTDEQGHSLIPPANDPRRATGGGGSWLMVRLLPPPDGNQRIARFRALATLLVQQKSQTLDLTAKDLADSSSRTLPIGTVSIQSSANLFTTGRTVRIVYNRTGPLDQWKLLTTAFAQAPPQVYDAAGRTMPCTGMSLQTAADQVTCTFQFMPNNMTSSPTDAKTLSRLVLEVPTEVSQVNVPVEFNNLPLP